MMMTRGRYGECDYFSRGAPSKYIGLSLVDGLWAFALGFACLHAHLGDSEIALERLQDFDAHDASLRNQLMGCLVHEARL